MQTILFVTSRLPPPHCGVGDYTYRFAKSFSNYGYKSVIIAKDEKSCEQKCIYTSDDLILIKKIIQEWNFSEIKKIFREVQKSGGDIVWLQYSPYGFNRYGICFFLLPWMIILKFKTRSKLRIFVTFHETNISWGKTIRHILLSLIHRIQFFLTGLFVDELFFTNENRTKNAIRLFKWKEKQIHYLPVGTNIMPHYYQSAEAKHFKKQLGIDRVCIIFGLTPYGDNVKTLLKFFAKFKEHTQEFLKLFIIGGYGDNSCGKIEEFKRIISQFNIEKNVEWIGPKSEETISKYLSIADVFLMLRGDGPNTRSGTLAAALAHGIPVLTSKSSKIDSVFIDGVNCLLFEDQESFVRQLLRLFQEKILWETLSKNSRKIYEQILLWDKLTQFCFPILRG